MIRVGTLFIALALILPSPAAEIIALKIPLSRYADRKLETEGIKLIADAPEASPFFNAGDELWDFSAAIGNQHFQTQSPLAWVVWNATSGRLVVKGDLASVWYLQQELKLEQIPRLGRVTAKIFEVKPNGPPLAATDIPTMTLSCMGNSGDKVLASQQNEQGTVEMEADMVLAPPGGLNDLKLYLTSFSEKQPKLQIYTGLSVRSGESLWVARDFDGKSGRDIQISMEVQLLDGTPAAELLMIQRENKAVPIAINDHETEKEIIKDMGTLTIRQVEPEFFLQFDPLYKKPNPDPFADLKGQPVGQPHFPTLEVPGFLQNWIEKSAWDLTEVSKSLGLSLKEGQDFMCYDPSTQRVFMFTKSPDNLEKFEEMFSWRCDVKSSMIMTTLDGDGQAKLLGRTGEKYGFNRVGPKNETLRSLKLEPTVGEYDDLVDLRINYENHSQPPMGLSIQSHLILGIGQPLEFLSKSSLKKHPSSVRVTAEVLR